MKNAAIKRFQWFLDSKRGGCGGVAAPGCGDDGNATVVVLVAVLVVTVAAVAAPSFHQTLKKQRNKDDHRFLFQFH